MGLVAADRPNIVLIVSDDMGYSDLGCYGGEIRTPHLDRLADQGVRFTNYYVNNMCWPTRASLLTGLYPRSAVAKSGPTSGFHPTTRTLPEVLRQQDYGTFMCGKWHLSDPEDPDGPQTPHRRGFDHFYGTLYGASDFFAPAGLQLDGQSRTHEWEDNPNYYYTDAITDNALRFLESHADEDSERPFLLYLAYNAAHWPLHAKPADIQAYQGHFKKGWDVLREERHARMKALGVVEPSWPLSPRHETVPAWADEPHRAWQERRMEVYAAQITSMDANIGRILEHLKATGQFENTLIVFQHDNGGCHVEYKPKRTGSWTRPFTTDGLKTPIKPGNVPEVMPGPQSSFQSYGYGWANLSNTPFRRFKQYDHEGGTRSPLIVCWPGGIPSERRGSIERGVWHAVDMMPTLLEASGSEAFAQKPVSLVGESFLSRVQARQPGAVSLRREPLFWTHSHGRAVRLGDWKLVSADKGPWELFNLRRDGTELVDLAAQHPDRVRELLGLYQAWLRDLRP